MTPLAAVSLAEAITEHLALLLGRIRAHAARSPSSRSPKYPLIPTGDGGCSLSEYGGTPHDPEVVTRVAALVARRRELGARRTALLRALVETHGEPLLVGDYVIDRGEGGYRVRPVVRL